MCQVFSFSCPPTASPLPTLCRCLACGAAAHTAPINKEFVILTHQRPCRHPLLPLTTRKRPEPSGSETRLLSLAALAFQPSTPTAAPCVPANGRSAARLESYLAILPTPITQLPTRRRRSLPWPALSRVSHGPVATQSVNACHRSLKGRATSTVFSPSLFRLPYWHWSASVAVVHRRHPCHRAGHHGDVHVTAFGSSGNLCIPQADTTICCEPRGLIRRRAPSFRRDWSPRSPKTSLVAAIRH